MLRMDSDANTDPTIQRTQCISQNQNRTYNMILMFVYIFFQKRKIHIRSCYFWAVKRQMTFFCMCSLLSQIYYNAYILLIIRGKSQCPLLPILYTLYHVQRHAFISVTFTVLEVSSSILIVYMSKSHSFKNCPIFRFVNFSLVFPLIIFLLISPKNGGSNNKDI